MCTSKVCRTFIPGIAGTTPGSVNLVRSLPSCSFRSFLYVFKFGATKSVGKSPFPRPAAATQFFLLWHSCIEVPVSPPTFVSRATGTWNTLSLPARCAYLHCSLLYERCVGVSAGAN